MIQLKYYKHITKPHYLKTARLPAHVKVKNKEMYKIMKTFNANEIRSLHIPQKK